MRRRSLLFLYLATAASIAASPTGVCQKIPQPAPESSAVATSMRPNIVLILADDQSYRDFGFMGNPLVQTPHLDRLAAESARYPNGYVPMSVCRPSLATLLTGLYPHQHGIHFNHPPPGLKQLRTLSADEYRAARAATDPLISNVPTLPRLLATHGYASLQTGKHWEGDFRTAGFTEGMTTGRPADRISDVTGTRSQDNGELVAHGNGDAGLLIGRETMQPIDDFVGRHAGRTPFFVWYAPFLPHTPFDAAARFRQMYQGSDVPDYLLPYYAEISRFDDTVGQLLQILERHDCRQHTVIVFVSDNGFRPTEEKPDRQNTRSKLSQFEDGLRTPVLISWPLHTVAATHTQIVQTVDIVPTVLSVAGLSSEKTDRMQGIDLLPSATGEADLPDRPAVGAIYPNDAATLFQPSRHVRARWIRDGNLKLIVPASTETRIPPALFNLTQDQSESRNLIDDPARAADVARLMQRLDDWWMATDDLQMSKF